MNDARPRRRAPRVSPAPWWLVALAGVALAYLVVPLLFMGAKVPWASFGRVITSDSARDALWLSVRTCAAAIVIDLVLGVPAAVALSRRWRGVRVARVLVALPLSLPPVVAGLALLVTFGRKGVLGAGLEAAGVHIAFSTIAVVMAQVFVSLPFLVITLEAALRSRTQGLEQTAAGLGAGPSRVLFTITLPTVAPGLARGTALALARCLGEFGATLTFAGSLQGVTRTMPLEIYLAREADSGTALTLGVVLIVAAAVIVALTEWSGRRRRPAAEDEPASPTPTDVPDPAGQQRAAAVPVHVDGAVTARDWQVSLDIPAGRVVAVMGRNGAGKSTLAQVLAGALALDSGTASIGPQVHDTATTFTPARRRGVAMVRQDPQVFAHLSVLANVAYPLRARGVPRAAARRAAHAQLAAVGADQLAFRRGDELSGGQAARVSLARALVFDPRLLILDEPTSALDVQARARVTQVLADRLAHRGTTTVLITHDVVEAVRLASWLVVLEHGRVAEQGEPARLLAAPTTDFTARLAGLNIVSGALIVGADALPGIAIGSRRLAAARIDPDSLFPGTLSPGELFPGALPPDALAPDTPLSDSMPPDSMPSASTAPGAGFPAPGSPVSLVFAPEAVSLFRVPQQGSPRSLLPGVVQAVDAASGLVTVRVALDDGPVISARITPAAWAELQLAVGQRLWCSVKATQVRLVPAPAPVGP
ncbi:Molybdate ABC superfamily ATP binding cassette transporter, permease protein [Propionibacterium freudenreichii]|nr:Molybdate ABC superfamily ATP binding cassette transporter, permease protein [Propionibacterium freudenreichii]SBW75886.1 Molybdate ABC transporter, permease protein [Propionibacterium freudenreichii]